MEILRDEFPGLASRIRVLVLGCGGAGKAAAAAAYMAGMQVCICNRTLSRAQGCWCSAVAEPVRQLRLRRIWPVCRSASATVPSAAHRIVPHISASSAGISRIPGQKGRDM